MGRILAVITVLVFSLASNTYAVQYVMRELQGDESYAQAINNSGTAVAYDCVWDQNGVRKLLGLLATSGDSFAMGINDSGCIAGESTSSDADRGRHACIWDAGGVHELKALGGWSSAQAINNLGFTVGRASTSNYQSSYHHACYWEPDGTYHELKRISPYYSEALALNNIGDIVGWSNVTSSIHACLWNAEGIHDLGTLGGDYSVACDINDKRQCVGYSNTKTYLTHATMWDITGIHDLGTLPGDSRSIASAVNNTGIVVGYSEHGNYTERACFWNSGVCTLLPMADGLLSSAAYDINDRGQIVGYVRDQLNPNYKHAVIWEPVPEPSSILALMCGVGWFAGMIRLKSNY